MKKLMMVLAAVIVLASLAACGNGGDNAVVVKTKSGNITKEDFYNELKKTNGEAVLQNLVYEKLLEKKYNVSKKAVDAKFNQVRKTFSTEAQFKQALAQNNLTEAQFRRQIKDSLMMTKAQQDGVKVNDKVLKDYYNKNKIQLTELKASHILIKSKKTAQSVLKKVKSGADFAKLAKQYSIDTGSKDKGGELGWFKQSTMVPEFSNAAMKLKVGQISPLVYSSTDGGYHIIKLEGKKDAYKDLKSSVKEAYLASKEKSQDEVIKSLIKKADVQVKDKEFKDIFDSSATTSTPTTTQQ
ncbi:peptidylprolyl isomerase [Sporolactobacillus kofuensis]|uniref:Foldase protein PrsA n=1 Tax=Sporolactobacillus kofuensis TaxID=269672 RepID=A0ABW1WFP6_9BACL|nr:peptidylprolyl isomerase [Sporolactobacillus kofuensis]MCO7176848.1 peptidylprolyl isomerase [Sporolactobacillus kofuensis]